MIVTRFAPSPTGLLHLGHAFAAFVAAESGERFVLRIEDLDKARVRPEFVEAIVRDLSWLGLTWEEPILRQSLRDGTYRVALETLHDMGLVYPCFCSRKEIADEIARASDAPHFDFISTARPEDALAAARMGPDGPVYPGTCRHMAHDACEAALAQGKPHVLRLDAAKAATMVSSLTFVEHGRVRAVDPLRFGDIVLARKDLPAAYHLAVVVDDAYQGINLVTRGEDLLPACHVQRLLQALLGLPEPAYAHHRLILDEAGKKFSKRDQAVTLQAMREAGETPGDVRAKIEF